MFQKCETKDHSREEYFAKSSVFREDTQPFYFSNGGGDSSDPVVLLTPYIPITCIPLLT